MRAVGLIVIGLTGCAPAALNIGGASDSGGPAASPTGGTPGGTTTPPTATAPGLSLDCPGEQFEGRQFAFCSDPVPWLVARQICDDAGGVLASIESEAENTFVARGLEAIGVGDGWIGATDFDEEGDWVWIDGSDWSFEAWNRYEPNNAYGGEHCAHAYSNATWNDLDCDSAVAFVCEADG